MKKIISLLISCCMLFASFAFTASAATVSTENELKAVLDDAAAAFHATNGTTKEDVLQYVESELPTAAVWATNGNYSFKKKLATEESAGFVNMGIGVTLDNVTIELYIFRQDIAPLSESQDAVNITADETAVKKAIDELSCNNNTTQEDILNAAQNAVANGSTVVWADDFYKKDATASGAGEVSGTIKLTLGNETRNITFKKIIAMGNTGEGEDSYLAEDWYEMGHAMSLMEVTNYTTKEELMNAALGAAIHGSTAEWTQFEITEATFDSAGEINGTFVVTLNGQTREHGYKKEIPQLAARKMPTDISVTKEEWEVLRLTNVERYKNGQYILTMTAAMQDSADIREQEVLVEDSHTRPDGSGFSSVFDDRFPHGLIGENLARDLPTPAKAMEAWMNSDEHRENILTGSYNYLGAGYILGDNGITHWVQLFAQSGSIVSVTTSSKTTHFANKEEMQREYFICTAADGTVSYAPIDVETMTRSGNTYTATGLAVSEPIVLTVDNVSTNDALSDGNTSVSTPTDVISGSVFADVPSGSYYADAVKWAVENGVTSGTSETTFSPNDTCTRGQVVTFLWRAMGNPEPLSSDNPFVDVNEEDYYYKAVLWAVEQGITAGTSADTFSPNDTCTSAQVVTFLYRSNNSSAVNEQCSPYYANAVKWAEDRDLLSGTDMEFNPDNNSPRSDIVTYLYRNSR